MTAAATRSPTRTQAATPQHIQLIISGGAEFKAFTYFTATLTGTVTIDFDFQDTVLTFDMNGDLRGHLPGQSRPGRRAFHHRLRRVQRHPDHLWGHGVSRGDAFDMLTDLGIEVEARGLFYINTDEIGHTVDADLHRRIPPRTSI